MSKLSPQNIKEILTLYEQNHSVSSIAKKFCVANMVVYYHIKTKKVYKYKKPTCYKDYIRNEIIVLRQKLEEAPEEKKKYIRNSIRMKEVSLGINTSRYGGDPYIFS